MKMGLYVLALCALVAAPVLVLQGCGDGKPEDEIAKLRKEQNKSGEGAESKTVPTKGGGTAAKKPSGSEAYPKDKGVAIVTGVVKFAGTPPKRPPVAGTEADPKCHDMHKDNPMLSEAVVCSASGELANCIVYVSDGIEKYKFEAPETPFTVSQKGCMYVPHTFAFMAGQPLIIENDDPTAHNVHEIGDRFNKQQAQLGQKDKVNVDDVVTSGLKCDIHPWMNANYRTFEHPFFAVSDEKGVFKFTEKLLPGKYKLTCWHLKYKEVTQDIEVKDGEAEVKANLEYKAKE
ncbi:MAG: hypothetical protein HY291_10610 [Planctomycetes bacterium]|nr:hypothetical protein [Planctomycetota bacterium]